jgi:hypothetical protein
VFRARLAALYLIVQFHRQVGLNQYHVETLSGLVSIGTWVEGRHVIGLLQAHGDVFCEK